MYYNTIIGAFNKIHKLLKLNKGRSIPDIDIGGLIGTSVRS